MSGPQGSDPTQAWQPQQPQHQPGSEPLDQGETQAAYSPNYPYQQPQSPSYSQPSAPPPPPPTYPSSPQQPTANQYGSSPHQPTAGQYGSTPHQPTAAYPSSPQQPAAGQYGGYGQPPAAGQYGGYGQPQPDYGQQPGQYGQQPGQFGQFGDQGGVPPKKKGGGAVIGIVAAVIILILVVVGITGFWKPGFFVTTKLDVNKAQEGVKSVLTDETNGYGAKNVQDVKCNNGANPTVKKGDTFTCDVSIDGQHRQLTVTFQDDDGTYEVGRPKG